MNNTQIHNNHFDPDKTYSCRPVQKISCGVEVLVVNDWGDAISGILTYVGKRRVVEGLVPCFSIRLIPQGHENSYDIDQAKVYQVIPKDVLNTTSPDLTLV